MMDPDPESMNPGPKHCIYMADLFKVYLKKYISVAADTYLYQEESLCATGVSNVVN